MEAPPGGVVDGRPGIMKRVSDSSVQRLSLYMRVLAELEGGGAETVSSETLAQMSGTTAAQVRKDLSQFGTFGKRGIGYRVADLRNELRTILGLSRSWRVALVGAGKIGKALLGYSGFRRQGFVIESVFDSDPRKIGRRVGGIEVRSIDELEQRLREDGTEIVIVAVPARAAREVVDRVVAAGVRGILNFAPVKLHVPPGVVLKNVNMVVELEGVSYALARAATNGESGGMTT
ncbi:MAG TPA: redox-sensing transcriptional repressor Rex [Longimicrobiales bacterium]|nr:redox-sensing transcriptional repressor Rex [Longimicrobiales bacterium]